MTHPCVFENWKVLVELSAYKLEKEMFSDIDMISYDMAKEVAYIKGCASVLSSEYETEE